MVSKMVINNEIGAIVIGRNEGERLRICLKSLAKSLNHIVYVDSGSTDGSAELAITMGVIVVPLDMTKPFTAARARNAGFKALLNNQPTLKHVHFIDGDCELISGWLTTASDFLEQNADYAVACGRRRERFPEKSIYNQLCDMEWNTPIGDASACGGDALIRVEAFVQVEGYRDNLIAGEEPEMCFRLRQKNWKIRRLGADMTWHDAAMTTFKQWWKRTVRSGHAFTEGAHLHGNSEERYWVKESNRIIIWGFIIPATIVMLTVFNTAFASLALIYPLQILRIASRASGDWTLKLKYGFFTVLGKFPEFIGSLRYWYAKLKHLTPSIIEYK